MPSLPRRILHWPLYALLRRSSCREAAERDAFRAAIPPDIGGAPAESPTDPARRRKIVLKALPLPLFRSIFYWRLSNGTAREHALGRIAAVLYPGFCCLEIGEHDIGPGLMLVHGHASVIHAERIGKDCTIGQHVTIGRRNGKLPVLGDRVMVWPGSMILGPVHIGDDAQIGAGALVLHDVPAGAIVVGNPARQIQPRTTRVEPPSSAPALTPTR